MEAYKNSLINKISNDYYSSLKSIREFVGPKPLGAYTDEDLIVFLQEKYKATRITYIEALDYLFYKIPGIKTTNRPISLLTEGYVLDEECGGIYLLPSKEALVSPKIERSNKDGAILVINVENNHLTSWWGGGNTTGYSQLKTELLIFQGSSLDDILSKY